MGYSSTIIRQVNFEFYVAVRFEQAWSHLQSKQGFLNLDLGIENPTPLTILSVARKKGMD